MKISRMTLYSNGKTRAFFDVETSEGMTVKGFKIMEGQNGLFVSLPSRKGKDDKWYDDVYMPRELKDELTDIAIKEYNSQIGGNQTPEIDDDVPF